MPSNRYLCCGHTYVTRINATLLNKPIVLSDTDRCSICRWEARPWTLKDVAVELRNIADAMEQAYIDPYSDPFGLTYSRPLIDAMKGLMDRTNSAYLETFLELIKGGK